MTDDAFNEAERNAFAALGFTVSDVVALVGGVTVEVKKWGPHHFHLRVVLPGGAELAGFMPRSRILPQVGEDVGQWRR